MFGFALGDLRGNQRAFAFGYLRWAPGLGYLPRGQNATIPHKNSVIQPGKNVEIYSRIYTVIQLILFKIMRLRFLLYFVLCSITYAFDELEKTLRFSRLNNL